MAARTAKILRAAPSRGRSNRGNGANAPAVQFATRARKEKICQNKLLTPQINANYSVSTSQPRENRRARRGPSQTMLEELDSLETKLAQLVGRYQTTREENLRLRQQVLALEDANKQLTERLGEARSKVETLFNQLPDE